MLAASLLRPFHIRGKARLLHKLCPREGTREASVFGYRMTLDLRSYIERSIYLGVFEPRETAIVRRYLRPGMVVVDAGANVGYYSLLAASKGCKVLAFEPSPYAVGKLREAVNRNGISNITVIESALGDYDGTDTIYISDSAANHTPSMVKRGGVAATRIPVATLDAFLKAHNIACVDLLKIDVEGYEPNVIRGARESLAGGRVSAVLCEFNEDWLLKNDSSPTQLFQTLKSFGFQSLDLFQETSALQNLLLVRAR